MVMPKRKKSVSSVNKDLVTRKVEKDILHLLQNQKRSCKTTVREIDGEIIISDDSSDFVLSNSNCLTRSSVTERISNVDSKSTNWVGAVETFIEENEMVKSQNKEKLADLACGQEKEDSSPKSSKELSSPKSSKELSSPEVFDFETELFSDTALDNYTSSELTKELSPSLKLQVELDPFTIYLPNDITFNENGVECEIATVSEPRNVDISDGKMERIRSDLHKPDLQSRQYVEVSRKVPNPVVLDGIKKQLTITSFFAGKSSKPTLSFVEDSSKNNALKEKPKIKPKAADLDNDVELIKSVVSGPKNCPFYKKIPGTNFAVDAFSYGAIPGIENYFLSHFHSDHYQGLNKHFRKPIFCSQVTANLVALKLRVYKSYLNVLPLNVATRVGEVEVTPVEANHCPGAVMFIFYFPKTGQRILHTGDFRFHRSMTSSILCPPLQDKIHQLFLDTTYLNPKYNFPLQEEVVDFVKSVVTTEARLKPKVLVICGSYTIGKEKVFMAAADVLDCNVWTSPEKYHVLKCLEDPALERLLVREASNARVHVLSMQKLSHPQLRSYLDGFRTCFNRIIAFRPTGWSHSPGKEITDIKPSIQGDIHIYNVPYSEHSSFGELEQFVKFLRPNKVIPTVNVGRPASRNQMDLHLQKWLKAV